VGYNTGDGYSQGMLSNLEQSPCIYKDKEGSPAFADVPFFQQSQH
jgi:hypothetical protein